MADNTTTVESQSKKCPKCKEDILKGAVKCKHCGADLRNWFNRHPILTVLLVLLFLPFVIAACNSVGDTRQDVRLAIEVENDPTKPVFDVPALVGLTTVDDVIKVLGKPKVDTEPNKAQLELGTKEWDKTYEKDGKTLFITYAVSNRHIVDFFIPSDDPSGASSSKAHLLKIGNLSPDDPRYAVEFRPALSDSSVYTGVKITPVK